MSETIASPSVRVLAQEKGIDIDALAKKLGRTTIGREDLEGTATPAATAAAPAAGTSYWNVDHSQYGPVTEEPMSRFAKVASANLSAARTGCDRRSSRTSPPQVPPPQPQGWWFLPDPHG